MTKKLQKHGNSYALVFDQSMMSLVGITPEVELDIATDGLSFLITPVGVPDGRAQFAKRAAEVRKKAKVG